MRQANSQLRERAPHQLPSNKPKSPGAHPKQCYAGAMQLALSRAALVSRSLTLKSSRVAKDSAILVLLAEPARSHIFVSVPCS